MTREEVERTDWSHEPAGERMEEAIDALIGGVGPKLWKDGRRPHDYRYSRSIEAALGALAFFRLTYWSLDFHPHPGFSGYANLGVNSFTYEYSPEDAADLDGYYVCEGEADDYAEPHPGPAPGSGAALAICRAILHFRRGDD